MTEIPESALEFKQGFIDRYSQLTDFPAFRAISLKYLRRSLRVNTLKTDVATVVKRLSPVWDLTPIPWCTNGFWVIGKDGRRDIGNTLEHQLGLIYIQEAASMIPPLVLNPQPGEFGLDMCASPGSKTTQIASLMKNKGCLIANDYRGDRLAPLGMNLIRTGILNVVTTLHKGHWFTRLPQRFDFVLCDAPCSGTGTIRKSWKTLRIWNPAMVTKLSKEQKRLAESSYIALKPGGRMVYSTCSLEPEEDEGVVSHLVRKFPEAEILPISLPGLKKASVVMEFNGEVYDPKVSECLRIWPQDNDTEGFFVALIRKPE